MIKILISGLILFYTIFFPANEPGHAVQTLASGQQPQLSTDVKGNIRIAFGRNDSIFCMLSTDMGKSFLPPVLVGKVNHMHLGMTRGPQIASSAKTSLITAMDKEGNMHSFLLDHRSGKWVKQSLVNDVNHSAPEGLMGLAADQADHYFAVWLDTRKENRNNIFFSAFNAAAGKWAANKLVYASPDEHVCECCKPSVAVNGRKVAVMFRNWLNGSRDLYVAVSENSGRTFENAVKLGEGTWKLNGCPMDGGGVSVDKSGNIHTVWRREGALYYSRPGQREIKIGNGKICSISTGNNNIIVAYQDAGITKIYDVSKHKETIIGKGAFIKPQSLRNHNIFCVWEDEGEVKGSVVTE